jgi:peptidoglycan/xylan/chitin deacetylase (PgdA/CDA1 family)
LLDMVSCRSGPRIYPSDISSQGLAMRRFLDLPWGIVPSWILGDRLKILMYHSISANPLDPNAISPEVFHSQMQRLRSRRVVSLQDGLESIRAGNPLRNLYVITFDDALLDFYINAMPILREFDYPVTMFVPSGLVGQHAKWDTYDNSKPLMSWGQLAQCQQWNVTFASHTVNHVRLTECSDLTLSYELQTSLHMLQNKLEKVISALAYPGGYQDARIRRAAGIAGYQYGLGASSRWGNGPESDLFQLRRQRFNP